MRPDPGGGCVASLGPANAVIRASGGARAIAVHAQAGCSWSAASSEPWIAPSREGGAVTVTVAANPGEAPRTGSVTVGGRVFTVFQDGTRALVHPRLWVTPGDVARLRGWATASNRHYKDFRRALEIATHDYDERFATGRWRDNGGVTWSSDVSEAYAEIFAFASLLAADPAEKASLADRAKKLFLKVIDEAALGPKKGAPFRDPAFGAYDRSRWWGEAFPLVLDWIYPAFDEAEKARARRVFLAWAEACEKSGNAPWLVKDDRKSLRQAANNYYLAHLRNLAMMALSLDPRDDLPVDQGKSEHDRGNTIRSYLDRVNTAWMAQVRRLFDGGDADGGLPVEGSLYGTSLQFVHQALLAMETSGHLDPAVGRDAAAFAASPYWDRYVDGFLASLTPERRPIAGLERLGPVFQMAPYGDLLRLWITPEWINVLGSMGALDLRTGAAPGRLEAVRWIAEHALEGGPDRLSQRAAAVWGNSDATRAIQYFMLFDPAAPPAADPRPARPLAFHAKTIGRLVARSSHAPDASMFAYICSWNTVTHQNANCNQIDFYRKGEWLTKERSGYSKSLPLSSLTDYHNTLSLENDPLGSPPLEWFEGSTSQRGSQWVMGMSAGDPTVLASTGPGYAFAEGDATPLYNRPARGGGGAMDIAHASRAVVWLAPDRIVAYDRATSKTAGRFKRSNLMLPAEPSITGDLASAATAGGQQVFVRALLPPGASITALPGEPDQIAEGETMRVRLVIEDPRKPADVRFLTVIEGADRGARPTPSRLVRSSGGAPFEGALVGSVVVMFPVRPLAGSFARLEYAAPAGVRAHVITGLAPGAGYDVAETRGSLAVTPGSAHHADAGGVLVVGSLHR